MPIVAAQIRRVRQDDWTDWRRLWTDYHVSGRAATSIPDTVTRITWERFFREHEPMDHPVMIAAFPISPCGLMTLSAFALGVGAFGFFLVDTINPPFKLRPGTSRRRARRFW